MRLTFLNKEQAKVAMNESLARKPRPPGYYDKYNAKKGRTSLFGSLFVDGEGCTIEKGPYSGEHGYVYLAAGNADGTHIYEKFNEEGISTNECFWFLVTLPKGFRKVGFSFGYDINMMLRDIDITKLKILKETGFVRWKGWRINWTPGKVFTVKRRAANNSHITCTVWDIFGYFQKSFVRTIFDWQVGTDEELAFVSRMKLRREVFTIEEIEEISSYCRLECKLGAEIFNKLIQSTKAVGLSLRRYDGAGSVAAAMLKKNNIQAYMHQTINRIPDEVIKSGYFGGRFDISTFGECGDAIEYDINSAYPYQAVRLPCLSCGSWEYSTHYDEREPWAIWNVSWNIPKSALWSPFPYRHKHGVYYLRNGSGWYWANEVLEAKALYGAAIQITQGYIYHQQCSHQPFKFISDYYERRRKLKSVGDLGQIVLKLGLNSLYGKLAQGIGRHGSIPQTQCLIWAGIITSNTRAMLLSQIRDAPDSALLLATDAVIRKSEFSASNVGNKLGDWEPSYLQKLFIICNGLYQAGRSGEVKNATRGFSSRDLYDDNNQINHWKVIRDRAKNEVAFSYPIQVTNFIGLGESLSEAVPLQHWRKWITSTRHVNYGKFKYKEIRNGRLYPGINPWGDEPSEPFEPDVYRIDDQAELLTNSSNQLLDAEEDAEL